MIDTKALRSRVLDLAIRGKLTEQLESDGTAEELYQQIQAEKQALIKEGKIKKEKPLPEILADEIPFEIPSNWKLVKLGNIGNWSAGATPSRREPAYYNGTIPWLKTGDLNDGVINEVSEYITEKALAECSLRLNPVGSVLIAMYGATIGKLGVLNIPVTTNQACCACIPYNGLFNQYLYYYLLFERNRFIDKGHGGAQPNISKEIIVSSVIPLPPLAEQKRIVERVEEIFRLLDTIDEAQEKYSADSQILKAKLITAGIQGKLTEQLDSDGTAEELYQQIQAEKQKLIKEGKLKKEKPLPAIKDEEIPFEIPGNWKWVRLQDIGSTNIGLTYHPTDVSNNGTIVIRSSNIQNGKMDYSDIVRVDCKINENQYLNHNDIVICARNGSKALVGKNAIYDGESNKVAFGAFMAVYRTICFKFIYYYFNTIAFKRYFSSDDSKQINQVTQAILKESVVPLPPLAEQKRIAEVLERVVGVLTVK